MPQNMDLISKMSQQFVVEKIKNTDWNGGSTAPLVVEFDTTETCMLACPGCISEDLVNHHNSFSNKRLLELAAEMVTSGVRAVILIGGGEPLAHPAAGDFMTYLGTHDVHIGITTNGVLIDRYLEQIAEFSKWTRVSMDAGTPETYMKLRPSKTGKNFFDRVITNMSNLAAVKKGKLGYSYLIRTEADGFGIESNIHEMYAAATLAKEIGCDYFEVKPSYSYAGGQAHALVKHSQQRMEEARAQIESLTELEDSKFKIIKAITLEDSLKRAESRQEKDYHTCPVTELRTLVTPTGVYLCPYWRGKDRFRLGDVHEQSFSAMWNGRQRKDVVEFADPSRVCQFHCLRHNSNLVILDMIRKNDTVGIPEFDRFI